MATENNNYTLAQLLPKINSNAFINANTPTSGSSTYNLYVSLLNDAINVWENEQNTLWNELWVMNPPTFTITAGLASVPLPTDFKFIGAGSIKLALANSTSVIGYPVKMLPEISLNPRTDQKEFYISGNPTTGYTLYLGWTPATGDQEIGAVCSFYYYKHANLLVNPTDMPEMSDPMFMVYKAAASIMAQSGNVANYERLEELANNSLINMTILNNKASNFMDDYIKDIDNLLGYTGNPQLSKFNSSYWTRGN